MHVKFGPIFFFLTISLVLRNARCDVFTAVFRMKEALAQERQTVSFAFYSLEKIDSKEMDNLDPGVGEFKSFILDMTSHHKGSHASNLSITDDHYVEHPINIFHVIKRMATDWRKKLELLFNENDQRIKRLHKYLYETVENRMIWPNKEDFDGVTLQIVVMQAMYLLDIKEFAQGTLNGTRTEPMTIDELFSIANNAYQADMYYEASLWYRGIADCVLEGIAGDSTSLRKALRRLATTYFRAEVIHKAIDVTKQALNLDPGNKQLESDLKYYEEKLQRQEEEEGKDPNKTLKLTPFDSETYYKEVFDNYYALCRGDVIRPPSYTKRLKCTWRKTLIPYRPAKMEYLNLNPPIVVFHDVIYEDEMNGVKQMAKHNMERSSMVAGTGKIVSKNRISETAWLDDSSRMIAKLSRRVSQITGLSTKIFPKAPHAEEFQIVNYGIGGMYRPHHDYLTSPNKDPSNPFFRDGAGDRIATWMFYINDVAVGGKTVFPLVNAAAPVTKGGAVFWPDMFLNGTGDPRTLHAGCPVVIGSKWVMNKWTRENGQFNRWRCGKTRHQRTKL